MTRRSRTYRIWAGIKKRCTNPNEQNYPRYGGKGIIYDPRWERFEVFLEDMGECPDGGSIDRVDPAGNYHPGNCRWVTPEEQARNRLKHYVVSYRGQEKNLAQWCDDLGLDYKNTHLRLTRGWSVEAAFETPRSEPRLYSFAGMSMTLREWSEYTGIDYHTLYQRLRRYGWPLEKAIGSARLAQARE